MTKYNYFDQNGNYINVENLSLAGIYMRGASRAAIGSATLKIVREYNEEIEEPGMSDYKKEQAKIHAFEEILKLYGECPESESEDAKEAMRDAETASKYLDDNEDTIAGRWHS
jgi:hypothetical protein